MLRSHFTSIALMASLVLFFLDSPGVIEAEEVPETLAVQIAKLTAMDATANDHMGGSVSVSGTTALVGAFRAAGGADGGSETGSAYIFERDQGGAENWGLVVKLTSMDIAAGDRFGYSVSVSGTTALVGAPADDDGGLSSGSAYVFERDQGGAGNWGQVAKLTAENAAESDIFGGSVSVSGTTALVGAYYDDDGGFNAGSAYVFERNQGGAGNWGQVAKLIAGDPGSQDSFGWSVSVSGATALVGAYRDDDGGSNSGSAYLFERDQGGAGNWGQVAKLTAADASSDDQFGSSVSVSGTSALVGAPWHDHDGIDDSGSAYLFERDQGGPGNWGLEAKLSAMDAAAHDIFGFSVFVNGTRLSSGPLGMMAKA